MTIDDIAGLKKAFAAAVRRAIKAGFDIIEVHSAHGYLLHEFLSPVVNNRTDGYGGSFENRIRLLLEIVDLTRAEMPVNMPLLVRVSATDWLEEVEEFKGKETWTLDQTVELAKILSQRGVDLLDVSSGGNHPNQKIKGGPGYQAPFAKAIKKAVGDAMAVGTVGSITSGVQANDLLEGKDGEQPLDLAIAGRMFQKNPGLVFAWADELGVQVQMPNQIRWGFGGRGKKKYVDKQKL
jgi:2,4-dienoyl-CoA reductase-like NADH-dependent reductase (Old Yellow Enzyme family)